MDSRKKKQKKTAPVSQCSALKQLTNQRRDSPWAGRVDKIDSSLLQSDTTVVDLVQSCAGRTRCIQREWIFNELERKAETGRHHFSLSVFGLSTRRQRARK